MAQEAKKPDVRKPAVVLRPAEGGSYRRNPDGTFTRVEEPTKPPLAKAKK